MSLVPTGLDSKLALQKGTCLALYSKWVLMPRTSKMLNWGKAELVKLLMNHIRCTIQLAMRLTTSPHPFQPFWGAISIWSYCSVVAHHPIRYFYSAWARSQSFHFSENNFTISSLMFACPDAFGVWQQKTHTCLIFCSCRNKSSPIISHSNIRISAALLYAVGILLLTNKFQNQMPSNNQEAPFQWCNGFHSGVTRAHAHTFYCSYSLRLGYRKTLHANQILLNKNWQIQNLEDMEPKQTALATASRGSLCPK